MGDTQVFIPLVKFLLQTFLSRSFILLTYSFLTFSYILAFVLWCLLPIYSTTSNFSSFFLSSRVLLLSCFCSSIPSVISLFSFFHYQHSTFFNTKFHSYIWTALFVVFSFFHFWQISWYYPCKWVGLLFPVNFYTPVYFLTI